MLGESDSNGNVLSQAVTAPGTPASFSQTYSYDGLHRLASAEKATGATPTWRQDYTQPDGGKTRLHGLREGRRGGAQLRKGSLPIADGGQDQQSRILFNMESDNIK